MLLQQINCIIGVMYTHIERWVIFAVVMLFFSSNTIAVDFSTYVHFHRPSEEASYKQPSDFFLYDVLNVVLQNSSAEESSTNECATSDTSVTPFLGTSGWLSAPVFLLVNHSFLSEDYCRLSWLPALLFILYCNWRL